MRQVGHHSASVVIMPNDSSKRMLVTFYDNNYPVRIFRGHYITIGGTSDGDASPLANMQREARQEISSSYPLEDATAGRVIGTSEADVINHGYLKSRVYAPDEKISALREDVAGSAVGWKDYFVRVKKWPILRTDEGDLTYISSVFLSRIDAGLFDCIEEELKAGRQVVNEGYARVLNPEKDVMLGLGAWGANTIVADVLGRPVREYNFINVERLHGGPRPSFADYKAEFAYDYDPEVKRVVRTAAGRT